jgi:NAD(P)-dependent dehydrogenase (short-subunit alcohol dehydrogenase family)
VDSDSRGVALITGGAGTIGIACARVLTENVILLADTSSERLASAAEQVGSGGADVRTAVCDVTDDSSVTALAKTLADIGPLRVLVHTAGLSGAMADSPRILDVNFAGTLRVLDATEPLVRPGTVGVAIASVSGHRGFARQYDAVLRVATAADALGLLTASGAAGLHPRAAYAVSKRGMILQVQRRAAAWGTRGGRLVSLSPGLLADTTMGGLVQSTGGESRAYAGRSAVGRAGTTADIAATVRFLASPGAGYLSGTDVLVDGGVLAATDHHLDAVARTRWHSAPVAD